MLNKPSLEDFIVIHTMPDGTHGAEDNLVKKVGARAYRLYRQYVSSNSPEHGLFAQISRRKPQTRDQIATKFKAITGFHPLRIVEEIQKHSK